MEKGLAYSVEKMGGLGNVEMYLVLNIVFIIISILYIKVEPRISCKDRIYVIWGLIILFSLLMATRPLETPDTAGYAQNFYLIQPGHKYPVNFLQKYMGYEFGYVYLISFFRLFCNNHSVFFFLTAFIGTSFMIFGLKNLSDKISSGNNKMYAPVFAIYISCFGLLYNGISIRAGLSMGLGIMAINLVLERRWVWGIMLFFIAFTMQRSAVLFLPIYFALKFIPGLKRKTHLWIWLISGGVLFTGLADRVFPYIASILNYIFIKFHVSGFGAFLLAPERRIGIRVVYFWLLYGVFILLLRYSKDYAKYMNVIMLGALIVVFMHGVRAVSRAYDIFYLFQVPLLGAMYQEDAPFINMKIERRVKILGIICANAVIMLKISFF